MQKKNWLKRVAFAVVVLGSVASTLAQSVIYDNTTTKANQNYAAGNGVEFGNEVIIGPGGSQGTINSFSFEYVAPTLVGTATADVRIYQNDGTLATSDPRSARPSTLLYNSGNFTLPASGANGSTVHLNSLNINVPDHFTWTVTFTGASTPVGLSVYGPPSVGNVFADMWQNNGSGWTLQASGASQLTFGAQIVGTPEPGTIALGAMGLIAVGGMLRKRKAA